MRRLPAPAFMMNPEALECDHETDDPHEGDRVQENPALAEEVEDDVQGVHGAAPDGVFKGVRLPLTGL